MQQQRQQQQPPPVRQMQQQGQQMQQPLPAAMTTAPLRLRLGVAAHPGKQQLDHLKVLLPLLLLQQRMPVLLVPLLVGLRHHSCASQRTAPSCLM